MIARVLQGVYSCLVQERYHGHPKSSLWLIYPRLKLSTSLLPYMFVNVFD
jgi:hypothetical protein